ncbi:MAG: peptide ABC transporter substrate-binding protein [Chloroflexi bacterium]|nr:peptide ABC transporter substrate-binding protein [Chloroflexota bacterium]
METFKGFTLTKKKIVFCLLLPLLIISLVLSSCQPATETTATTYNSNAVLNLYGIDPLTLDPAVAGEATSQEYILQIFSGLITLDDNLQPAADIAKSWKVSGNSTVYTFTLRQGVKFQDGRGVKADDFKYSWERACNPTTGSQTAATYLGDIVGVKEMLAGEASSISGVKVINDYTLQVTIDAPKSYFLYKLTYTTAFVVDRNNVSQGANWWKQPNGTGPFKLKQWSANSSLVLERNPLFYGEMAKVASVNYELWAGVPMRMYEMGQIDVTDVSLPYIDQVTDKSGSYYTQLMTVPELSFYYIEFNCTKPPFDDANVRRAFSMAIDKEKLVSLVYKDMMQKADGILPPDIPGYNSQLKGLEFNPQQALELIKASQYGDVSKLPSITITTAGYGGAISSYLEAIVNEWRQNLGVEVTVRQIDPERFLYHMEDELDEMYDTGWIADYPHPQDFLETLFASNAQNNYGGYSNLEVDALLEKAGVEPDSAKSLTMYQQAEQILVDDAACLPLWFGKNYVLVKPNVKGYNPTAMGYPKLNEVSINK